MLPRDRFGYFLIISGGSIVLMAITAFLIPIRNILQFWWLLLGVACISSGVIGIISWWYHTLPPADPRATSQAPVTRNPSPPPAAASPPPPAAPPASPPPPPTSVAPPNVAPPTLNLPTYNAQTKLSPFLTEFLAERFNQMLLPEFRAYVLRLLQQRGYTIPEFESQKQEVNILVEKQSTQVLVRIERRKLFHPIEAEVVRDVQALMVCRRIQHALIITTGGKFTEAAKQASIEISGYTVELIAGEVFAHWAWQYGLP